MSLELREHIYFIQYGFFHAAFLFGFFRDTLAQGTFIFHTSQLQLLHLLPSINYLFHQQKTSVTFQQLL